MERLIITADDTLYYRLARQVEVEGDTPTRASTVLQGWEQAVARQPAMILLDMNLRSADTLLEALHGRLAQLPAAVELVAIAPAGRLPFPLRRFCTAVLNRET